MKPKVAFFDFASCEGCQLQIANLEEDIIELTSLVDVVSFREVMKEHSDDYDIAFIEGSIQRPIDEERLRQIRQNAKLVIPIGACACTGGVNKLRTEDKLEMAREEVYGIADPVDLRGNPFFDTFHTKAVDEVVDVDFYIRGCPVRKEQILYYVKRFYGIPPHRNIDVRYPIITPEAPVDTRSLVHYDRNKCIICRRCDTVCCSVLGVDALGVVEKGPDVIISTPKDIGFDENGCIHCGQCVSMCSVGALEAHADLTPLIKELRGEQGERCIMVAVLDSIALASYVLQHPGLSGLEPMEAEASITAALRHAGFDHVVQYEPYVQLSLTMDAKATNNGTRPGPRMTSWCRSAFNYVRDRIPEGTIRFSEDQAPWHLMLEDLTGRAGDPGEEGKDGVDGVKVGKEGKDEEGGKDGGNSKDVVDGKNSKDVVDGKNSKDVVDGKNSKDVVDGKNSKDVVDGKNSKDSRDDGDASGSDVPTPAPVVPYRPRIPRFCLDHGTDGAQCNVSVTLVSPCTALKAVREISHVLSAMELDELFKGMDIDVAAMLPDEVPYDGMTSDRGVWNPGVAPLRNFEGTPVIPFPISHDLPHTLASRESDGSLIEIHPCIMRCLNGGGTYPSVDAEVMKQRKDWLLRLWGDVR